MCDGFDCPAATYGTFDASVFEDLLVLIFTVEDVHEFVRTFWWEADWCWLVGKNR